MGNMCTNTLSFSSSIRVFIKRNTRFSNFTEHEEKLPYFSFQQYYANNENSKSIIILIYTKI